jgi:hypothetical protein
MKAPKMTEQEFIAKFKKAGFELYKTSGIEKQISEGPKNFDRIIKWAIIEGFECNYESVGKWHCEYTGETLSNIQLFKRFQDKHKTP